MKTQKIILILAFLLIASPVVAGPYVTGKLGANFPVTSAPDQNNTVLMNYPDGTGLDPDYFEERDETLTTEDMPGLALGGSIGYAFMEDSRIQPRLEFEILHVRRKSVVQSNVEGIPGTWVSTPGLAVDVFEGYRAPVLTSTIIDTSQTYYFVSGFVDYWVKEKVVNLYAGGGIDVAGEASHASIGAYYKPVIDSPLGVDLQVRYLFNGDSKSPLFNLGVRYEF